MAKTRKRPYQGTQAVRRALALLKVFRDDRPVWTLAELTEKLNLNKTTVFRLLTALESEGLVSRAPNSDAYTLGSEMIVLGGRAVRSNQLREVSHSVLEELARNTRETTTLEILSGYEVVIIDEVLGDHLMGGTQSLGTRWPAFATSTGKAILAYSPGILESLLRRRLPQITPETITDPQFLRREIGRVREDGFAIASEALELGFVAVGAPVFNYSGEVVAAISAGGPTVRLTSDRLPDLGEKLRKAAKKISNKLGYRK